MPFLVLELLISIGFENQARENVCYRYVNQKLNQSLS